MTIISEYLNASKPKNVLKSQIARNKNLLNEVDSDGKTIVHHAAEVGDVQFLNMIMSFLKPDVLSKFSVEGKTPLAYAANIGDKTTFNFLLKMGSDINLHGEGGSSALFELFSREATMHLAISYIELNHKIGLGLAEELGERSDRTLFPVLYSNFNSISNELLSSYTDYYTESSTVEGLDEDGNVIGNHQDFVDF